MTLLGFFYVLMVCLVALGVVIREERRMKSERGGRTARLLTVGTLKQVK